MKTLFAFAQGLLLVFCLFAVQAEDIELIPQEQIVEAPSSDPMKDEAIIFLQGEDMYQGTLSSKAAKLLPTLITI